MYPKAPQTIPLFDLLRDELDFIREALLKYESAMHTVQARPNSAQIDDADGHVEHAEVQRFDLALQMLSDLALLCQHMKDAHPSFTPPPIPEDVLRLERSRLKFGDQSKSRSSPEPQSSTKIHLF